VNNSNNAAFAGGCILIGVFIAFIGLLVFVPTLFGYVQHKVDDTEVGVLVDAGEFQEVVGSGIYNKPFDWYADIINVSITGLDFRAEDPEVLTRGAEQRIGVVVTGTIFRPEVITRDLWTQWKNFYTDDAQLVAKIQQFAAQAMKVCVGQRTFEEAAVGAERDALRTCIEDELTRLASEMGIRVEQVVVPDVIISERARQLLDELTEANQQAELAVANTRRVEAETQRTIAEQQGAIRVQEGSNQELLRQRAIASELEQQALLSEQAVLETQIENNLITAEGEQRLAVIELEISRLEAEANTALIAAQAAVFDGNPEYAAFRNAEVLASVLAGTEMIYLPYGSNPLYIAGGENGVEPLVTVPAETTESSE
jgi:hypothetical protein